jgi:uncharacterized OB-fold protein
MTNGHTPATCPVCGSETKIVSYHVGGKGDVEAVVCPVGLPSLDDKHPGIIRTLPRAWRMAA